MQEKTRIPFRVNGHLLDFKGKRKHLSRLGHLHFHLQSSRKRNAQKTDEIDLGLHLWPDDSRPIQSRSAWDGGRGQAGKQASSGPGQAPV